MTKVGRLALRKIGPEKREKVDGDKELKKSTPPTRRWKQDGIMTNAVFMVCNHRKFCNW